MTSAVDHHASGERQVDRLLDGSLGPDKSLGDTQVGLSLGGNDSDPKRIADRDPGAESPVRIGQNSRRSLEGILRRRSNGALVDRLAGVGIGDSRALVTDPGGLQNSSSSDLKPRVPPALICTVMLGPYRPWTDSTLGLDENGLNRESRAIDGESGPDRSTQPT